MVGRQPRPAAAQRPVGGRSGRRHGRIGGDVMPATSGDVGEDRGAILIIVLVIAVILSVTVIAVANYAGATLRYGRVAENRTHRVAAAQAAMDDAIERLELKRSLCSALSGTA